VPHNHGYGRRRFLSAAMAAFGVSDLVAASGHLRSGTPLPTVDGMPVTSGSMGTLKQVAAGVLNVGYAEAGPSSDRPVILLHGWPYDIHSFTEVVPLLASAGYRVLVPYLRGYGTTRFLSSETFRNGQRAALALDVISLMDALAIDKAVVDGVWGSKPARRSLTRSKRRSRRLRPCPYRPSHSRGTLTGLRTPTASSTRRSSQARIRIASSQEASDTICRSRRLERLPKRSSTSSACECRGMPGRRV
jgi:hypothetical protein